MVEIAYSIGYVYTKCICILCLYIHSQLHITLNVIQLLLNYSKQKYTSVELFILIIIIQYVFCIFFVILFLYISICFHYCFLPVAIDTARENGEIESIGAKFK